MISHFSLDPSSHQRDFLSSTDTRLNVMSKSIFYISILTFIISWSFLALVEGEVQSLKTDKKYYFQTNKIVLSGTEVNDTGNQQVNLEITGPQGNYIDTFTTIPNTNGSFQIVLDTNTTKIKSELSQQGNYSAIAFIKTRSASIPVVFYYSPVPPIPPRPFTLYPNQIGVQNKSQNTVVSTVTHQQNQPASNTSFNKIPMISGKRTGLNDSTILQKPLTVTNATIESSQQKPLVSNSKSDQVNCSTLSSDQQYKCQQNQVYSQTAPEHVQQPGQQLQATNGNQIITPQSPPQDTTYYIKGGITAAVIIGMVVIIIYRETRTRDLNPSIVKETGSLYGVSYHPRTRDGVRIHASSCRHVANASQSGSTRWLAIRGYQAAKSQAESMSISQNTYWKNAQCCLDGIINKTLGGALFLTLFPFFGLLGGLIVKEYYPNLGKGLMYFGLMYGILVCIWWPR